MKTFQVMFRLLYTSALFFFILSINGRAETVTKQEARDLASHPESGCQANFTVIQDSISLLTFYFQDQSLGTNIISWTWSFGDGQTQTIIFPASPNVNHSYALAGNYLACLTIQGNDSLCYDHICDTIIVGYNHTCIANFTYSDSANTAYPTQFVDLSQASGGGHITSWFWNFGDSASGGNNTSTVQNPVHLFSSPGAYIVCLTIHGTNNICYDSICKYIIVLGSSGCDAIFSYYGQINPNRTIYFLDQSAGNPVNWLWDFGDPITGSCNSSSLQNPTHIFSSPGTYNVCLTIESNTCFDTSCQAVLVIDSTNYQHIYGQVFAGYFPLISGIAMLFSVDSIPPYSQLVDTSMIDSLGTYYFAMVPPGSYYIYAIPFYPVEYLPTYYGDALNWQNATLVTLGQPANPYIIHLFLADTLLPGNGNISGNINVSGLKTVSIADEIMMLLMNSEGKAIASVRSNSEGFFEFKSLAYGNYLLKAELSGIESDLISVDLTQEHPNSNITMTFSGKKILGIYDRPQEVIAGVVYPNPVTDIANIIVRSNRPANLKIDIYNMMGQLVYRNPISINAGETPIKIPTGTLPNGFYSLRIYSKDGININRKFVK